jgi:hypothetical protein
MGNIIDSIIQVLGQFTWRTSFILYKWYFNSYLRKNCFVQKNSKSQNAKLLCNVRVKCIVLGCALIVISVILLAIKQLPMIREMSHYVLIGINLVMKSCCTAGLICITCILHPIKKCSYGLERYHMPCTWYMAISCIL